MPVPPAPDAFVSPLDDIALLGFEGPDARAFLQAQLANDVAALTAGRGQWTSYNSAKGRVLANLWLWQSALAERYDALVARDLAAAMQKRLSMFVLRAKLRVVDRAASHRLFGVTGSGAAVAVAAALGRAPEPGHAVAAATLPVEIAALPDGRFVVVAPQDFAVATGAALGAHASPAGVERWHAFGVAAGVAWVTAATSDQFVLQMLNFDALSGVSFQKGCYPGQEVVARMRYLGRLKERLFRLHADAPPPVAGTRLYSPVFGEQPCGTVVDAAPDDRGGADFLAVLQLAAADAPGLALATPDGAAVERRALPYALPELAAARERPA